MQSPTSLGELFTHPSFISLFLTFLLVIGNVMVGVSMLPKDGRKKRYKMHRLIHFGVVVMLIAFLVVNETSKGNSWFHYLVFIYFLLVVPLTRKIHVTLHAVLASIGLVLLGTMVVFII